MPLNPPSPLVGTAWLADHLDDPSVRLIDSTYFLPDAGRDAAAEYATGHIPGAVFFDIDAIADASNPLPHMLPSPELFAERVGALGIGNDDFVVSYDSHGLFSAARAWWMFRVFGHDKVAVLDGGLPRWTGDGHVVDDRPVTPAPARFEARFRPELVRSSDDILANLSGGVARVVDVRSPGRFEGSEPEPRPECRSGHIPASTNLHYASLIDRETRKLLAPDDLKARFEEPGLSGDGPFIASCGSGVTACIFALAKQVTGHDAVAIYDGSWTEWGSRDDLPLETGTNQRR